MSKKPDWDGLVCFCVLLLELRGLRRCIELKQKEGEMNRVKDVEIWKNLEKRVPEGKSRTEYNRDHSKKKNKKNLQQQKVMCVRKTAASWAMSTTT